MCLIYVPKIVQIAIRILLPLFILKHKFLTEKHSKCHRNSFELKRLQSSILRPLRSMSVSCEKRSVLIKMNLCFGKRFRAVKNLCKNRSICIKDTAPTFFNQKSKYPPDTAHTNSSREQLLVTKKAVGCVRESHGKGGIV